MICVFLLFVICYFLMEHFACLVMKYVIREFWKKDTIRKKEKRTIKQILVENLSQGETWIKNYRVRIPILKSTQMNS